MPNVLSNFSFVTFGKGAVPTKTWRRLFFVHFGVVEVRFSLANNAAIVGVNHSASTLDSIAGFQKFIASFALN